MSVGPFTREAFERHKRHFAERATNQKGATMDMPALKEPDVTYMTRQDLESEYERLTTLVDEMEKAIVELAEEKYALEAEVYRLKSS